MERRLFTTPGAAVSGLSLDIANLYYAPINHNHNLTGLQDVSGVWTSGQLIQFDGSKFVPLDVSGVNNSNLSELGDVAIASATTGDLLRFNGTKWVNINEGFVTDGGNF